MNSRAVALGMAFSGLNTGGVRQYIEKIAKKSQYDISIFPEYEVDKLWLTTQNTNIRQDYSRRIILDQQTIINNHQLFHSNVDPTYIKLCEEAQRQGKKWIHTYHFYYKPEYEKTGKLFDWQEEINDAIFNIANKADIKLCVGEWLVDDLRSKGIESIYLPNFTDTSHAFPATDGRFLLFISDASFKKNCIEFIKVADLCPTYNFVLIGTGLTRENLEKTYNITLNKNIIALGPLGHNETMRYISSCSSLIISSLGEGLPTILLEAMSFAKPCIIPIGPVWSNNLFDNGEVIKYKLGDILDLKNKVQAIMDNYRSIPEAINCVAKHFSSDVVIKKLDTIYKELLNE